MQEEFERKIQERMHTFGIQPSPQVWGDIDAVLSKKKHHRVFIGWWILLGLLVAGGGIFILEKDQLLHNTIEQPAITRDTTQNNIAGNQPASAPVADQKTTQNTEPAGPVAKNDIEKANVQKLATGDKRAPQIQKAINPGYKGISTQTPSGVVKAVAGNQQPTEKQEIITPQANKEPPSVALDNKEQPAVPQSTSPVTDPLDKAASSTAAIPAKRKEKITAKTIMSAGHQWFFTLSAGVLQTDKKSLLSNDKSLSVADPSSYNTNILALTSPAALKYDIASPGTGFIVSAGAVYQYKLSPRWQVYGGLDVAFLTNTQKAGSLYLSSFSLNTGLFTSGTGGQVQPSYYQGGQDDLNTVVNKAWQLRAQAGTNFIVNPRGKAKIFLDAGLSSAWMLTSRWLIPDARYGKLYYNKQVLNNTIISWQAGPGIQLKNDMKFGLEYQQSFTTLAKSYVTPHLKWENINVYTAIPFSFKSKKSKH